jgi:hypothetical protein
LDADYLAAVPSEPEADHVPAPRPGTIYSVEGSPNVLKPADMRLARDYPMEAFCLGCDEIIRLGQILAIGPEGSWQHTGRKPAE